MEEVAAIDLLAEAYMDVAKLKLEKVRSGIIRNREFVGEIAKVLHLVRIAAEARGLSAKRKKLVSAAVVLTSNSRFSYGDLDSRMVEFFLAHTVYTGFADRFVIGAVGKDILTGKKYPFPFESTIFSKDFPTKDELLLLAGKLINYQQVIVYYPRFVTVMSQQPSFVDMTGLVAGAAKTDEEYYIFEPEIDKILDFFEAQVMAMLLEQAFFELELARIGSQLVAMDNAALNDQKIMVEQNRLLARARRSKLSMEVLERVANMRQKQLQTYD